MNGVRQKQRFHPHAPRKLHLEIEREARRRSCEYGRCSSYESMTYMSEGEAGMNIEVRIVGISHSSYRFIQNIALIPSIP